MRITTYSLGCSTVAMFNRVAGGNFTKAADISAELDEVANSPALLIAAISEPISTVYKAWRERDVFAKINMSDLAVVAASLNELATAATSALKARSKK